MNEQDTTPAYDMYIEEDRLTFVRRPEPVVDSAPAPAPLHFVPVVMLGSHGLIALLALMLTAYLSLVPATATVYALADRVPALARVYALPAISMSKSESVSTTGHVHVPATQARGLVTFYNSLTSPQVIEAGTLLIGSDGQDVVTDDTAYVSGSNLPVMGSVSVWAHALNPGVEGNIKAGDIQGACCRPFIQAVNSAFSGGYDARDAQVVTKADIDTASAGLAAQVQHSLQERMASLLPPGSAMLTPIPCSAHTASNHPVGAQAAQIMVTVRQSCTPAAYSVHELEHSLASLIAGKTPAQAQALLRKQGIGSAAIRLAWLRDRLPADASRIRMVIVFH